MNLDLIPLTMTLYGKVKIDLGWFGSKTVFKKRIWHYQTPKIQKEIFNIHNKEPDESPPQFVEFTTSTVGRLFYTNLKVADQITLENKFCFQDNFKIRSVFI